MRRRLGVLAIAVAVVAVAVLVTREQRDAGTGRVDVVFDTAKGMVEGQLVKIAGARAGRVDDVRLTADNQARMRLRVEERFLPFRADASCRILPEGPISENYVECDPGQRTGSRLASSAGAPTVPVAQTTAPVSIQDLLDVFAAPAEQRMRLLLNELGIATAGRGEDVDDLLRRSNPALSRTTEVLRVVNGQRDALRRAIAQTDEVLDGLAADERAVDRFAGGAAATAEATASRRAQLGTAVRELPGMLREVRAGLRSVDRATAAGEPLLGDLEAAAPVLERVTTSLPGFARQGTPAVQQVAAAAKEGRRAVRPARKVARSADALGDVTPVIRDVKRLQVSSRDQGAIEQLLRVPYSLANLASLYNGVSHVITLFAGVQIQCIVPTPQPIRGCDATYRAGGVPINDPGQLGRTHQVLRDALERLLGPANRQRRPRPAAPGRRPAASKPATPALPDLQPLPGKAEKPVKALPEAVRKALDDVQGLLTPPKQPDAAKGDGVRRLLDLLLGP
ncbi:MlaD family protein [Conexibacter sp. SYSU D00693]|uniref:MlaD family protein n=1 Tax=Conexibacter sp. SYSU D00693 TaxID=2812560 RepID=UPI00196A5DDB|nr:MlaD family protein [Conexibacter sp. SYSU D00693]